MNTRTTVNKDSKLKPAVTQAAADALKSNSIINNSRAFSSVSSRKTDTPPSGSRAKSKSETEVTFKAKTKGPGTIIAQLVQISHDQSTTSQTTEEIPQQLKIGQLKKHNIVHSIVATEDTTVKAEQSVQQATTTTISNQLQQTTTETAQIHTAISALQPTATPQLVDNTCVAQPVVK